MLTHCDKKQNNQISEKFEKRREISRDAARLRRNNETDIFIELQDCVPIVDEPKVSHVDRIALLRLTSSYIRFRQLASRVLKPSSACATLDQNVESTLLSELFNESDIDNFLNGFLLVVDSQASIVYVSPSVSVTLGITQTDLVGHSLYGFLKEEDALEFKETLETCEMDQQCRKFLRMKSVLGARGRSLNLRSALYKTVAFTISKCHLWSDVVNGSTSLGAVAEPSQTNDGSCADVVDRCRLNGSTTATSSVDDVDVALRQRRRRRRRRRTTTICGGGGDAISTPSIDDDIFVVKRRRDDDVDDALNGVLVADGEDESGATISDDAIAEIGDDLAMESDAAAGVDGDYFFMFASTVSRNGCNAVEPQCHSDVFVTQHSMDMKVTYCNDKLSEHLGYDKTLTGLSFFSLVHPQDLAHLKSSFKLLYRKHQMVTDAYRVMTESGGYIWLITEASIVVQGSRSGRGQHVLCVHYVISDSSTSEMLSDVQVELNLLASQRKKNQQRCTPFENAPIASPPAVSTFESRNKLASQASATSKPSSYSTPSNLNGERALCDSIAPPATTYRMPAAATSMPIFEHAGPSAASLHWLFRDNAYAFSARDSLPVVDELDAVAAASAAAAHSPDASAADILSSNDRISPVEHQQRFGRDDGKFGQLPTCDFAANFAAAPESVACNDVTTAVAYPRRAYDNVNVIPQRNNDVINFGPFDNNAAAGGVFARRRDDVTDFASFLVADNPSYGRSNYAKGNVAVFDDGGEIAAGPKPSASVDDVRFGFGRRALGSTSDFVGDDAAPAFHRYDAAAAPSAAGNAAASVTRVSDAAFKCIDTVAAMGTQPSANGNVYPSMPDADFLSTKNMNDKLDDLATLAPFVDTGELVSLDFAAGDLNIPLDYGDFKDLSAAMFTPGKKANTACFSSQVQYQNQDITANYCMPIPSYFFPPTECDALQYRYPDCELSTCDSGQDYDEIFPSFYSINAETCPVSAVIPFADHSANQKSDPAKFVSTSLANQQQQMSYNNQQLHNNQQENAESTENYVNDASSPRSFVACKKEATSDLPPDPALSLLLSSPPVSDHYLSPPYQLDDLDIKLNAADISAAAAELFDGNIDLESFLCDAKTPPSKDCFSLADFSSGGDSAAKRSSFEDAAAVENLRRALFLDDVVAVGVDDSAAVDEFFANVKSSAAASPTPPPSVCDPSPFSSTPASPSTATASNPSKTSPPPLTLSSPPAVIVEAAPEIGSFLTVNDNGASNNGAVSSISEPPLAYITAPAASIDSDLTTALRPAVSDAGHAYARNKAASSALPSWPLDFGRQQSSSLAFKRGRSEFEANGFAVSSNCAPSDLSCAAAISIDENHRVKTSVESSSDWTSANHSQSSALLEEKYVDSGQRSVKSEDAGCSAAPDAFYVTADQFLMNYRRSGKEHQCLPSTIDNLAESSSFADGKGAPAMFTDSYRLPKRKRPTVAQNIDNAMRVRESDTGIAAALSAGLSVLPSSKFSSTSSLIKASNNSAVVDLLTSGISSYPSSTNQRCNGAGTRQRAVPAGIKASTRPVGGSGPATNYVAGGNGFGVNESFNGSGGSYASANRVSGTVLGLNARAASSSARQRVGNASTGRVGLSNQSHYSNYQPDRVLFKTNGITAHAANKQWFVDHRLTSSSDLREPAPPHRSGAVRSNATESLLRNVAAFRSSVASQPAPSSYRSASSTMYENAAHYRGSGATGVAAAFRSSAAGESSPVPAPSFYRSGPTSSSENAVHHRSGGIGVAAYRSSATGESSPALSLYRSGPASSSSKNVADHRGRGNVGVATADQASALKSAKQATKPAYVQSSWNGYGSGNSFYANPSSSRPVQPIVVTPICTNNGEPALKMKRLNDGNGIMVNFSTLDRANSSNGGVRRRIGAF